MLRAGAAARQAGITDVAWARVIKKGRGYESTFVAMARVVGVEAEVREALGLPPLDGGVTRLPAGRIAPRDVYEERILAAPLSREVQERVIAFHRAPGGGREILQDLGLEPAPLTRARRG